MVKWITAFFMAWGCFSAIPCPFRRWDEELRPRMIVCLPFIGGIIGLIWTGAAILFGKYVSAGAFGAALVSLLPYLLSGFIHLDGFMDCCDAILSRRGLSERRRILKDPHTGAFAVISVVIVLLLNFSAFLSADWFGSSKVLVFIPIMTRCCSALAVNLVKPMETSEYAGKYRERKAGWQVIVILFTACGAMTLCVIFCGRAALSAAAAVLGSVLALHCGVRWLGGMSGDISGFAITLGELAGTAAVVFM